MSTAPSLSTRAVSSWEANASYWDATITREGNKYWRRLQEPCLGRLLGSTLENGLHGGCKALDLATGNGLCARWLARHGARSVLATDASENMLALAKGHCEVGTPDERIRFGRVDVTSGGDMRRLVEEEEGGFDVVLMNMAVMDVADLEPLAKALGGGLLAKGYNPTTGDEEIVRGKVIKEYMSVPPAMGIAVPGQPEKQQLYFHRPMHELFATFFKAGLVMDAMEELAFTEEDAEEDRIESTTNFPQLPAILAFRMRLR
ncbi:S-adenosyl-L-methionine-dependent methyltransferase [Parathielavia appendiculata]|uniref:S-adenosyl-L-methionine-dependent methyltransferase n=1 Tax=Parathielavia appendiculata TaxID=2587402 RepID=A0AAN6TTS8_9PEZI|nr:S-adenosyl-L-methionine-dependent methyltransferase [Parathielavia appendiculata]